LTFLLIVATRGFRENFGWVKNSKIDFSLARNTIAACGKVIKMTFKEASCPSSGFGGEEMES